MNTVALANPAGGVAVVGSMSTSSQGNHLTVTTQNGAGGNFSAINWQSFSIPQGSSTYFAQPSSTSTVINRVVTSTPSQLYGTLGSNGQLVLINQSGITVGTGAVVDTAGFTASALKMGDADALAGRLRFGDGTAGGNVSVQGQVLARQGDVVLIGSTVDTGKDALIRSPNGSTILAAGNQVEITGRGLEGISMTVQAPENSAVNMGSLQAGAVGIFAGTLKHSGAIQATRATLEGGKVVLRAAGDAIVDGSATITATGTTGGSVDVLGQRVGLLDQASIDVSGTSGGGKVRIGGDFQGRNTAVPNAQTTYVGQNASIQANATDQGDGGSVIVWADGVTRYAGTISARGGALRGNGGQVEVSGKHHLDFRGSVDTSATKGQRGTLLLDPYDLIVNDIRAHDIDGTGTGSGADLTSGTQLGSASAFSGTAIDSTTPSEITATQVASLLNTTDVTLAASNNITLSSAITKTGNSNVTTLKLDAGGYIYANNTISSSGAALNVDMRASSGIYLGTTGQINTNGGSVSLVASSGTVGNGYGSINSVGGNIKIKASGNISLASVISSGQGRSVADAGNAGDITLYADGQLNVTTVNANGGIASGPYRGGNGGTISVTANACANCDVSSSISDLQANYGSGYSGNGVAGSATISAQHYFWLSSTLNMDKLTVNTVGGLNLANTSVSLNSLSISTTGSVNLPSSMGSLASLSISTTGGVTLPSSTALNYLSLSYVDANAQTLTNTGALTVAGVSTGGGAFTLDNTGAVSVQGAINTGAGALSITAHSPITIAANLTSSGNITLNAPTTNTTSNITLQPGYSIQSSGGSVSLSAYNNVNQYGYVYGSSGVSASTTTGTINFGMTGYSGGSPLSYSQAGASVVPPLVPLVVTTGSALGDTTTAATDQPLDLLDAQLVADATDPEKKKESVVAGEVALCP